MGNNSVNISNIRRLSSRYAVVELEACIQEELKNGSNACLLIQDQSAAISILSMAGFVRARMEQDDISVYQALRILGQRMRGLTKLSSKSECNDFN